MQIFCSSRLMTLSWNPLFFPQQLMHELFIVLSDLLIFLATVVHNNKPLNVRLSQCNLSGCHSSFIRLCMNSKGSRYISLLPKGHCWFGMNGWVVEATDWWDAHNCNHYFINNLTIILREKMKTYIKTTFFTKGEREIWEEPWGLQYSGSDWRDTLFGDWVCATTFTTDQIAL